MDFLIPGIGFICSGILLIYGALKMVHKQAWGMVLVVLGILGYILSLGIWYIIKSLSGIH